MPIFEMASLENHQFHHTLDLCAVNTNRNTCLTYLPSVLRWCLMKHSEA
jgi:hypothetical protein